MTYTKHTMEEMHRVTHRTNTPELAVALCSRQLRMVEKLRSDYGCDSVKTDGNFQIGSRKRFGHTFLVVRLDMEIDTDRITIYDTEVPA